MDLTFAQDFSTPFQLDTGLLGVPDSGLYWNQGVHPTVNLKNIIALLPHQDFTATAYDDSKTYSKFETSRSFNDVVLYEGELYLSLQGSNVSNLPDESSSYWLLTNIESLRIRAFLWNVDDNVQAALKLQRKLIESQKIYHISETLTTPSQDYIGWAFEPKGSDYVKIRINKIALQANTTDPVTLSVINQGILVDSITLNPNNGLFEFEDVSYTISGKGRFLFVIPSQDVYTDGAYNEALKANSFVAYPVTGVGTTAAGADYTDCVSGNGFGFDVSVYLDSSDYITSNLIDFAKLRQSQFQYDFLRMLLNNSHAVSNRNENILRNINMNLINIEVYDSTNANTVVRQYKELMKEAKDAVNLTFDRFLKTPKRLRAKHKTI